MAINEIRREAWCGKFLRTEHPNWGDPYYTWHVTAFAIETDAAGRILVEYTATASLRTEPTTEQTSALRASLIEAATKLAGWGPDDQVVML